MQHPVAGLHRHAADVDRLPHDAGHGDRGVGPQQLLDRGRDQVGLGDQAPAVVGVLREVPQRGADRAPRRVDAGDDQQLAGAEHVRVRHRLAVDLAVEQLGDEVVARVALAVLDDLGQEAEQRLAGAQAQRDVGRARARGVPAPRPVKVVGHVARDAHELGDDPGRDLLGVVGGGVGAALVDEAVDERVAQRPRARLVLLDRLRRERRQQEAPRPGVLGRVGVDGRGVHVLGARARPRGGRR